MPLPFLHYRVRRRVVFPHVVAVQQEENLSFASSDKQMLVRPARRVDQDRRSTRTHVRIVRIEGALIEGCEKIEHPQRWSAQFEIAIRKVGWQGRGSAGPVKNAIPGEYVQI